MKVYKDSAGVISYEAPGCADHVIGFCRKTVDLARAAAVAEDPHRFIPTPMGLGKLTYIGDIIDGEFVPC